MIRFLPECGMVTDRNPAFQEFSFYFFSMHKGLEIIHTGRVVVCSDQTKIVMYEHSQSNFIQCGCEHLHTLFSPDF